ncbi:beta-1,3-N-acetylglucosaminyltransferase lunatic fringe-like [Glandiceps talaboti]
MRLRAKRTLQGLVLTAFICLIAINWILPNGHSKISAEVQTLQEHQPLNNRVGGIRPRRIFHDGRHIQGLPDGQLDSLAKNLDFKTQDVNSNDTQGPDHEGLEHGHAVVDKHGHLLPELTEQKSIIPNDSVAHSAEDSLLVEPKQDEIKFQRPIMATPVNNLRKTRLSDVFIGVKTTKRYHRDRLDLAIDTWVSMALDQTYFFTDSEDEVYSEKLHGHLIDTNCSSQHTRQALCCKMSVMYDAFLQSNKRWFCHLDDDNYLNTVQLVKLLQQYKHTDDVYLGKPSLTHPIEALDRVSNLIKSYFLLQRRVSFWFGTGGAGFCLSRALALHMSPYASGGTFTSMCQRIRLPDDVTIGFIVEVLLKKKLTVVKQFNSHLQALWQIKKGELPQQVTLSYGSNIAKNKNVITMDSTVIPVKEDPTRLRSFHCAMFLGTGSCPDNMPRLFSPSDVMPQLKQKVEYYKPISKL